MSAALRIVHAQPAEIADAIDEARLLVAAAGMAAMDLVEDDGRDALRTLLSVIEDKLQTISKTVWPGRGQ